MVELIKLFLGSNLAISSLILIIHAYNLALTNEMLLSKDGVGAMFVVFFATGGLYRIIVDLTR